MYRALGHYDANDAWVPPISFKEALDFPKPMMDVFFRLDDTLDRMRQQKLKKGQK